MIRRVAIIGVGAFGEIMLEAMANPREKERGMDIVASHRRPERRDELREKYGIQVYSDNREACKDADMVCPMVRPGQMQELMEEIGPVIEDDQIVATGAAALPLSFYRQHLTSNCTLAWVFPTAFMLMEKGYLAICPEPGSDAAHLHDLEAYWGRFCESIVTIGEQAMDAFVLLHASGQVFLWPVIKAFVEFGASNGFTREEAQAITLSTFEAAGAWLKTRDTSPMGLERMMDDVSVPGSLSEAGLAVLKRNYVESLFAQTLEAGLAQAVVNRERAV